MKKHICPFLGMSEKCVHKTKSAGNNKVICPYNNPLKCKYYNEWLDQRKSIRELPEHVREDIKKTVEEYKRRWIK